MSLKENEIIFIEQLMSVSNDDSVTWYMNDEYIVSVNKGHNICKVDQSYISLYESCIKIDTPEYPSPVFIMAIDDDIMANLKLAVDSNIERNCDRVFKSIFANLIKPEVIEPVQEDLTDSILHVREYLKKSKTLVIE